MSFSNTAKKKAKSSSDADDSSSVEHNLRKRDGSSICVVTRIGVFSLKKKLRCALLAVSESLSFYSLVLSMQDVTLVRRHEALLNTEKQKSDEMLASILPQIVMKRMKENQVIPWFQIWSNVYAGPNC